jgi:hypothetical protein
MLAEATSSDHIKHAQMADRRKKIQKELALLIRPFDPWVCRRMHYEGEEYEKKR